MVSKTKYCSLVLLIAILLMESIGEASVFSFCLEAYNDVQEGSYTKETLSTKLTKSRKVLAMLKCNSELNAPTRIGNGEKVVARELRTAPSGPDPLHHHGGSPKKPRNDP